MSNNEYTTKILLLPEDPSDETITQTAKELKMLNFSPILLIETPNFIYLKKADIISEISRISNLKDDELPAFDSQSFSSTEDFRLKHYNLLYFYYELICRLRQGEPEAWDYVHELYEDD